MTTQNLGLPFSQSAGGKPIVVTATSTPGTLIHQSTTEIDFIWLWLSLNSYTSYTDQVIARIMKGKTSTGYSVDSVIHLPPGKKIAVESGTVLTDNVGLYLSIDPLSTITNVPISASGYVYRRIQ